MVDFDVQDHPEGGRPRYEIDIFTQEGFLGLSLSRPNCSVLFPPLINLSKPEKSLHVDARVLYSEREFRMRYGLLVDGNDDCFDKDGERESCLKKAFLTYDLSPFFAAPESVIYYPGLTMVLRLLKWGCTWSTQCDPDNYNGDQCDLTPPSPGGPCKSKGNLTINAVPCWEGELDYDTQDRLLRTIPKQEIGRILVDNQTYVWLEIPLDVEIVREWALKYGKKLCLNIEAENADLNDTVVLYGGTADEYDDPVTYKQKSNFGQRIGWHEKPNPELLIIRGRAWNCTGSICDVDCRGSQGTNVYNDQCIPEGGKYKKCADCCQINVTMGTGIKDKRLQFTTHIDTANILLDRIEYGVEGMFSNAQGSEKENVAARLVF